MSHNNNYSKLKAEKKMRQERYVNSVLSCSDANSSVRGSSFGRVRRSNNPLLHPSFVL